MKGKSVNKKIKTSKQLKAKRMSAIKRSSEKVRPAAPEAAPKVKQVWLKADLKKFKELLLKQREKMAGEVEHITKDTLKTSQKDASGDLSGYTLHMADMSGDNYEREMSLGIVSSEQGVIYDIDEALRKLRDGQYGVCITCEEKITKSRLKVVPYAKHCISCQQKEELMNKKNR